VSTPHVLVFHIGQHLLSLPLDAISEIFVLSQVTRVPVAPVFMRHVVAFRGMVLPVVDLAPFLGESVRATVTHRTGVAVHLDVPNPSFALVLDSVVSVATGKAQPDASADLPFFVDAEMSLPKGVTAWNVSPLRIEKFILGQLSSAQRKFGVAYDEQ